MANNEEKLHNLINHLQVLMTNLENFEKTFNRIKADADELCRRINGKFQHGN